MTTEQKVDRILQLLEGTAHSPGLLQRVEKNEVILYGEANSFGVVQKVNILWRIHALAAGGVGTVLGAGIAYFLKH